MSLENLSFIEASLHFIETSVRDSEVSKLKKTLYTFKLYPLCFIRPNCIHYVLKKYILMLQKKTIHI